METTDVEKAFELLNKLDFEDGKFEITDALIDMAEWTKQQLIDKCKEFCNRQTIGEYYNRRGVFQIDKYIDDMLNFIKRG
jgi:hypothetical protein